MKIYKVFDIFRSRTLPNTFLILVHDNLLKVNTSMYEKLLKGYVYKYDTIKIIEEDKGSGIIFEIVEDKCDDTLSYQYLDYIYNKYNLLPFLTDTLPYYQEEVEKISNTNKNGLVGRIKYKTRINHKNNKYYLFYILQIDDELVKGMIWKENFRYSSLKINDEVLITKYRQSKGYLNQGHIENNEFSELSYFDIREITITELYLINEKGGEKDGINKGSMNKGSINKGNMNKGSINKESMNEESINKESINKESMNEESMNEESMNEESMNEESMNEESINKGSMNKKDGNNFDKIFSDISGVIKYRSVLNRRNHYGYSEYYLLNVEDKKIILFYNSDLDFYKIEAGNKIKIRNLKETNRNGFIFYISTIFTQFEYENINEMDERCSTFLYESDIKRVKKEDNTIDGANTDFSNDNMTNDESRIRRNQNDSSNMVDNSELFDDININNDDIRQILNDSSVVINLEITTPSKRKIEINEENVFKYIESGYGFLPDSLDTYKDKEENINNKKYTNSFFFPPKKVSLEELESFCNKLVINESDKFIVEGRVQSIEKFNEEYSIRYIDTGDIKEQYPIIVNIENNISFYIFGNFFTGEVEYEDLIKNIPCDIKECEDQEFIFILHVFRASIEHVIYSISGMYKK
jgi:hypothetical protein